MKIMLENTELCVGSRVTLHELLVGRSFSTEGITVAVNNRIVPPEEWAACFLSNGNKVHVMPVGKHNPVSDLFPRPENTIPSTHIDIRLNTQRLRFEKTVSLGEVLAEHGIRSDEATVALNNRVISGEAWNDTPLKNGDRIDTIRKQGPYLVHIAPTETTTDPLQHKGMDIFLNNQKCNAAENTTLLALLENRQIRTEGIAVAINNCIVPRSEWDRTTLPEGCKITVIRATCGG